ncbi:hypothetical protein RF11_06188 [Thelohanellus kitauei]|uniref:Uncharacterized protein n=1 Tax=Thelohanellus kitauei TaxID=669202 RepID=A0A0C2J3M9_THEKT|nr:hypothetical protein RF11_06188 [Thelohanellus kitauei]
MEEPDEFSATGMDNPHNHIQYSSPTGGEVSEKLFDSITGLGLDRLISVIDCSHEIRKYLLNAVDNHQNVKNWVEKFDHTYKDLSSKIRKNISDLVEIDKARSIVKIGLKAKKLIKWYELESKLMDIQSMMFALKDIEIILDNDFYKKAGSTERTNLLKIKDEIRTSVKDIITNCLELVVYVLINDKSFESYIFDFFNIWITSFHHEFIRTISIINFEGLNTFLNDSIKLFSLIHDLDISILNTNPEYFSKDVFQSYSHHLWSLISTNVKNKCAEFFKIQTNCVYVFEKNYLQFYYYFNLIDEHFGDRKYQFSKSAKLSDVISDNFEIKFFNKISKTFNNFLNEVFSIEIPLSTIYNQLNDLLNNFYSQIDYASTFNSEITCNLHERFFQFIEVLCSRIFKTESTDVSPKQKTHTVSFVVVSIIQNFITTVLGVNINISYIIQDKISLLGSIVSDCLNYYREVISKTLNVLYDIPIKLVASDYLQLPRFKYQDVNVSNIVIEIKNHIQNWSNIYVDLKMKSHNYQLDILNFVIGKVSPLIIQSCLIIKFSTEKHKSNIIDDNLGLTKLFNSLNLNPNLVHSHKALISFLKPKVSGIDRDAVKELIQHGCDSFLVAYSIINNRENEDLFMSKFTNLYEFYHWLNHNPSQSRRKTLIGYDFCLCQRATLWK